MDRERMNAAIVERYRARLDPNDPALIGVELNRLSTSASAGPRFSIMSRQRLKMIQRDLFAQLDRAGF
jgi:hypothetical protein